MLDFLNKFELSRGGGNANVRPMEGLRGFAVFLVFLVHYSTSATPWLGASSMLGAARVIHSIGNAGVDLFFVLSGYLIYGSLLDRRQSYAGFLGRRLKRIYPAFTVVFLLYLGLSLAVPAQSRIPVAPGPAAAYLLENFLLLPGMVAIEPMITVAWSLSYEMFYYIVLPLIIAGLGLRQRSAPWRVAFFGCLLMAGLLAHAFFGGPVRLGMFVAGIMLYEACKAGHPRRPSTLATVAVLVASLILVAVPIAGGQALKMVALAASFFLLCYRCFEGGNALAQLFSWSPLRWFGNMSYSYYLLHGLAIQAVFILIKKMGLEAVQPALFYFGMMPLVFAATLVPTVILFLAVERPFSLGRARPALSSSAVLGGAPRQPPMAP